MALASVIRSENPEIAAVKTVLATAAFAALLAAPALAAGTAQDRAFVAKVGPGGMFEVQASQLAQTRASAPDVRDFAAMEVHDHTLVGDRLKAISSREGVMAPSALTPEFQAKLERLKALSGPAFDAAYMRDMADLHPKDGAAFAQEAAAGGSADYRTFGAETHKIVERHIGAIQAVPPR